MTPAATDVAAPLGAAEADAAAQAKPARRKGLLLAGVVGLVVAAGVGGGAWWFAPHLPSWARPFGGHDKASAPAEVPVKVTVPLGSLVVNVGPIDARRYLKIGVELGVPNAAVAKEIEEKKPQIADLLITVLGTMPVEVLGGESGRRAIKKELLARIKEELALDHVGRVYITEFVIQ